MKLLGNFLVLTFLFVLGNFPNLNSFLTLPGILMTSGILKGVGNLVQPGILFVLGMENWSSENYET